MAELVANCPRCAVSKTTFDLLQSTVVNIQYNWQSWHEAFCICRHCHKSTVFVLTDVSSRAADIVQVKGLNMLKGPVNELVTVETYVSAKDSSPIAPPEHLPEDMRAVFAEGSACLAIGCNNAAGTMFRLCIDKATQAMLPEENSNGLNSSTRRSLGLRLAWLLNNGVLPEALRELASCIKDDGNDGAHEGSLAKEDAEDLLDFTFVLLERIYTEPARLRIASARRVSRREKRLG
jgi:hypothetical protein